VRTNKVNEYGYIFRLLNGQIGQGIGLMNWGHFAYLQKVSKNIMKVDLTV